MKNYRAPGFQDRIGAAARARTEAIAQLRAKPPVDADVVAARAASRMAAEAAMQEKRTLARLATEARKAAKQTRIDAPAVKVEASEAERKQLRDARYAARKKRVAS